MSRPRAGRTTSVRRFASNVTVKLARLKAMVGEASEQAWAIGDMVNELKAAGVTVKEQAELIGASRQRLSELRRTAAAFPSARRRAGVDFHFCTVAMRSARRLGLTPADVVEDLVSRGIDSTRAATRYLAAQLRAREAARAAGVRRTAAIGGSSVLDRCHDADYRLVLPRLERGSVKLIVADPPYGRYGKYRDGKHTRVTAAARDCDGMADDAARALTGDLFRLARRVIGGDGCLILFRPGGLADPAWLMRSSERHGWECRHALTWRRGPTKLGDGQAPYASATERVLVFAQAGARLVNHDGSSRCDIVDVPVPRKSYAGADQHLFEKPVDLMALLISKHTFPGETVVEPFGGTGPVCRAAIRLGRRWLYCESNRQNFKLGGSLIERETLQKHPAAG